MTRLLVLGLALLATAATAQPFERIDLGALPGETSSTTVAISADGNIVVGSGGGSFIWTEATGIQSMGAPPSSAFLVEPLGLSASGTVACGQAAFDTDNQTTVWDGTWRVHSAGFSSACLRLSADGSTLIGREAPDVFTLFLYRASASGGGRSRLTMPSGITSSNGAEVFGLSADGSVAVGIATQLVGGIFRERPIIWNGTTGTFLPNDGGTSESRAIAVSADGTTVVGRTFSSLTLSAVRWRNGARLVLGPGEATHVSADGSIVAGRVPNAAGFDDLFVWTEATGAVRQPLPPGWRGVSVKGMSADGQVIVGNKDGFGVPYVWTRTGGFVEASTISGTVTGVSADGSTLFGQSGRAFIIRLAPSTGLVVTDPGDTPDADPGDGTCADSDGRCTLRAAIEEANDPDGPEQTITFALAPGSEIAPQTPLPALARAMTLDGARQPDALPILNGGLLAGAASGLTVTGTGVTIRGLTIVNFPGLGVRVDGVASVRIVGSRVGVLADGTPAPNDGGALRVSGDASIGSRGPAADRNVFFGPVGVTPGARARMLLNTYEVNPADATGLALRAPLDVGPEADGPTCGAWGRSPGSVPAPPRILDLTASRVRGLSTPGDTVAVYRVEERGTGNGRYWARKVTPVGLAATDATGAFDLAVSLASGDEIVLSALTADGQTSELSQARHPVIFAPGIGGTWLRSQEATDLWLPVALGSDAKNERMRRIALEPDGATSVEPIVANEVLEGLGPVRAIYGPIHDHLEAQGYPGHPFNENAPTLDQWRFPNDWRLSAATLANDFRALVDRLTTASGQTAQSAARACQTDVIAHSNGGVIASVYLRRDATHARDRVHRFITSGTPYLGADQAWAAHANGYVFGADESPLRALGGWDVAWGDMIGMVRNVPGAYALLPSRAYFDAVDETTPSHAHGYGLVDLYNVPLDGYDDTIDFLTRSKLDLGIVPSGLARNALIRENQETTVQGVIADWRTYEGPPQIFRHVGQTVGQTEVGWFMGPGPEFVEPNDTARSETGDTDRHRAYRERLRPVYGLGDHTVPLVSATLGRSPLVGRLDLSGVDESPWIEEFEGYDCAHGKLVEAGCRPVSGDGPDALVRLTDLLAAGTRVPFPSRLASRGPSVQAAEVIYAMATAPVTVTVTDAAGRVTGPPNPTLPGDVSYGVPGIRYAATRFGATLGLPPDSAYTVTVRSADPNTVLTLVRQRHGLDGATQILFPDQPLPDAGTLTLTLVASGTPDDTPWARDANGDGSPESTVAPAAVLARTASVLALPLPQPTTIDEPAADNTDVRTVTLRLPDTGSAGWTFELHEGASWIAASALTGGVPSEITLTLDPAGLPNGPVSDVLRVDLLNGDYATRVDVPVTLRVGLVVAGEPMPETPTALALTAWPNPTRGSVRIGAALPEAGEIRLSLIDALGREAAVPLSGVRPAGWHEVTLDASALVPGVYIVQLTTSAGAVTRRLTVVR